MSQPLVVKSLSILINLVIYFLGGLVILLLNRGFGSRDIFLFMIFVLPLAVAIAVSGETMLELISVKNTFFHFLLIALGAIAFSAIYLFFLQKYLGPQGLLFNQESYYLLVLAAAGQLLFLNQFLTINPDSKNFLQIFFGLALFPLVIGLMFVGISGMNQLRRQMNTLPPSIVLLPVGFEGRFRIVFGEACGNAPTFEQGNRLFRIPNSGIYITQLDSEPGILNYQFYFVDELGKRTQANQENAKEDAMKQVLTVKSAVLEGPLNEADSSPQPGIQFMEFVSIPEDQKNQPLKESFEENERLDSITVEMVKKCRNHLK